MWIVINALGIQDSGGITVLERLLQDTLASKYAFLILVHNNSNIQMLKEKFGNYENLYFRVIQSRGILHRLYYENTILKKIINEYNIKLVYNFSGSAQFFLTIPQLTKIHNLLFYSTKIEQAYFEKKEYLKWFKQIFLKRVVFHVLIKQAKYIEVQSAHVEENIGNFLDIGNKKFFIKSDIDICENEFLKPKNYDFNKKIKFFYIVGPHFESLHKNFEEFVQAMLLLQKQNFDFEIVLTLTKEQLHGSVLWDASLDKNTTFLGYSSKSKLQQQFKNNTILISTSIIETLGLHVIEAIQNGVLVIVPDEPYSRSVYGQDTVSYQLYSPVSLVEKIYDMTLLDNQAIRDIIQKNQNYLIQNESKKYHSVIEIFDEILKDNDV